MGYPRHVGIIMDGNRRFAQNNSQLPWKGHEAGSRKLYDVLEWCEELGVTTLTVFAFSMQNFSRASDEVSELMHIFENGLRDMKKKLRTFSEKGVRIRFIGRLHLFADPLSALMQEISQATANHTTYVLNIAVGYGGREEILDAVRALISSGVSSDEISEKLFSQYLSLSCEPELIIRTGGAIRTSNFLLWQSQYSEWMFIDTLWPNFSKEEFVSCLHEFSSRKRNFGK